ncbi:MAG TPA: SdrD B-like domain-containing protein [Patescibacteria group bacterium]|nr:SdrD B-like domain-containing protein [Patescibacteria group bacterium]
MEFLGKATWKTLFIFLLLFTASALFPKQQYAHFIAGKLYYDTNGDGKLDGGENTYPNGHIKITGQATQTVTPFDPSTGRYEFNNIPSGWYTVTWLDPPNGYIAPSYRVKTGSGCNVGGNKDANCTSTNDVNDLDIGYYTQASANTISGEVFLDANQNGILDYGEYGYDGWEGGTNKGPATVKATKGNQTVSGQTDGSGNYSITGLGNGNWCVTLKLPTPNSFTETSTDPQCVTITNSGATVDFGIYENENVISGTVFIDSDGNGILDNGEIGYTGGTSVTATSYTNGNIDKQYTVTTYPDGTYSLINLRTDCYTVSIVVPTGYTSTSPNPLTNICVSSNANAPNTNFGINSPVQTYCVSGFNYVDVNANNKYDPGVDTLYAGTGSAQTVTVTNVPNGGTITDTAPITNGSYSQCGLPAGTYTATYNGPPPSYYLTNPAPSIFTLTVGPNCTTSSNTSLCDANDNVVGANYGITNQEHWLQGICADIRSDSSFGFTDLIPSSANCGGTSAPYATITNNTCTNSSGVLFSGNTNPALGGGTANANNWIVGGTQYGEVFSPRMQNAIATSYESLIANIQSAGTPYNLLSNYCTLSDCVLPANLQPGVYEATGPVSMDAAPYTFPVSSGNTSNAYIFLINGSLMFNGSIIDPAGTEDIFSTTGDMTVAPTVGENTVTSLAGDLEGLFTTDGSFIVASQYGIGQHCDANTGKPLDLKLNVQGAVITNAVNTGGSFQMLRDLCNQDLSCPTVTVSNRVDMLLNLPQPSRNTNSLFQEIAP